MNDKIAVSRSLAKEILTKLHERRDQLAGELGSVEGQIQEIEAQLTGTIAASEQSTAKATQTLAEPSLGKKAPKGQNLRIIKTFMENLKGQGVTPSEISNKTHVGQSSVQVVLKRHSDLFALGSDKLWRLKK